MKPFKRLGLLSQTLRKLHSGRVTAKGYSKPDSDPTNSRKQLEIRAREILRGAFGHEEFRKNQLEPILRTCEGLRSLVILPTSGGKSAIFQIAGIMLEGTTLVISPLISLMDDQVRHANERGLNAAAIHSNVFQKDILKILERFRHGELKFLYISPERLFSVRLQAAISQTKISIVAIDEAHCIYQDGLSYRTSYLKVFAFIEQLEVQRVVCLSATISKWQEQEIRRSLNIPESGVLRESSFRPNLKLEATGLEKGGKKKALLRTLMEGQKPYLIYCTTKGHLRRLTKSLTSEFTWIEVAEYHAGLLSKPRREVQRKYFETDKNLATLATRAFGLGIDKKDLREMVHFTIPSSLEDYAQQIGRAGRDGEQSLCHLYVNEQDIYEWEAMIRSSQGSLKSVRKFLQYLCTSAWEGESTGDKLYIDVWRSQPDLNLWDITIEKLLAMLDTLAKHPDKKFEDIKYLSSIPVRRKPHRYRILGRRSFEEFTEEAYLKDLCKETTTILECSRLPPGGKYWQVDLGVAEEKHGVLLSDMELLLKKWHHGQIIDLISLGSERGFQVTRPLPTTPQELEKLAAVLHNGLKSHVDLLLRALQKVVEAVNARDGTCIHGAIVENFGDKIPDGRCGKCTACLTGIGANMSLKLYTFHERSGYMCIGGGEITDERLDTVITYLGEKSKSWKNLLDPETCAAVAFGTRTPALRHTGVASATKKAFGIMKDCHYEDLVPAFRKRLEERERGTDLVTGNDKRKSKTGWEEGDVGGYFTTNLT